MMNIKKRSEEQEEFSNLKIENSLRSAGANDRIAREISDGVTHRDGLETSEVRKLVVEKLKHHNPKLGKSYETYEKPARFRK